MELTKKQLLGHISELIAFDHYAFYQLNDRPQDFRASYRVLYRNKYGIRLMLEIDNKHGYIHVLIDYIGAFK